MRRSVAQNAFWIIACKAAQALMALVIGMITARYLGPSNYGLISYASSIVAFLVPIMKLGFNGTLVQEIIIDPENEGKVMGTSLLLCFIASLASIVGILSFTMIFNAGETETIIVCFLYSLTLTFQAGEMLQYWFQAKLLSKYPSIISLLAYACVSVYKIYILVTGKNIRWFAVTHTIEAAIISGLLIAIYGRVCEKKLAVSFALGKQLLSRSRYYISSGLMMVLFQQTDRVMLKLMCGAEETGYYSAAYTCVSMSAFVFAAVIESIRPSILKSKKNASGEYEKGLLLLCSIVIYLSLGQGVVMTLLSKPMIFLMFGTSYAPSAGVLRILVWYAIFGYIGMARNVWILAEEKQKYLWKLNLAGAIANVACNALLIPLLGANGAAISTVLSQFLAEYAVCFLVKPMRPIGVIMNKSFNPRHLMQFVKSYVKQC